MSPTVPGSARLRTTLTLGLLAGATLGGATKALAQEHQHHLQGPPAAAAAAAPPAAPSDSGGISLWTNLGTLHRRVTTRSADAQRYFDQGLRLAYGFNQEASRASFEEATRRDSTCAMCWWGIAYVIGPNLNFPMDTGAVRPAHTAIQRAMALAPGASPLERETIRATAKRYAADPTTNRAPLDTAYARAISAVAKRHPSDPDLQTLHAESLMLLSPWYYWERGGKPRPATGEIVATLARTVRRYPRHPGACHFYIHAVEASNDPGRALPCARRLASLMPGAGHLVHMPAHIYMRVGRYDLAAEHNEHAAAVDEHYIEGPHPNGLYPFSYYPHNLHFLWAARTMQGRSDEAIRAARKLESKLNFDVLKMAPPFEFVIPTADFGLARFGRWDELLAEPPPPADFKWSRAIWHYARGLARAGKGDVEAARAELDTVEAAAAATPPEAPLGNNTAKAVLEVATHHLAGAIAGAAGDSRQQIAHLERAMALEDALHYSEPPDWYLPIREVLGRAYLDAGRPADAARAFREDLVRFPENGWSLHGLALALRAEGKPAQARAVEARFRKAWTGADVKLAGL